MANLILRGAAIDKKVLDYALQIISQSDGWWQDAMPGTAFSRRDQFQEYRLRMDGRRSVAGLYKDAKDEPFQNSANIGVPAEQIFSEFLIPTLLANTHDLEPMLQAVDTQTEEVDDPLTAFHDRYHRVELGTKRQLLEESTREVLTVGSAFHKWTWGSVWKQRDVEFTVFTSPLDGQPVMRPNPQTGQREPWFVDPKMPEDLWPVDPIMGIKLNVKKVPATDFTLVREGPQITLVTVESILFPPSANTIDPDSWDYAGHRYAVSPWWFLGRDGDPFDGKLQHLPLLWKWLGVKADEVHRRPDGTLNKPVKLVELQMKFPVDASGKPVEVIALVAEDAKLLLAWRVSRFPRRNLFARQVFSRGQHPLGKGIPETAYGLRSALDASVNQDVDYGNLYNHPPLLLSSLAMLEDEDYETTGPGTQWVMTDINGAKFLPPPAGARHPIERENWLLSMLQRQWGVTDLNLNAPTDSLAPSLNTARGTMAVLNQGSIKFGHLTKRLSETDTLEYQFGHQLFADMLANPKTVSIRGKPVTITPEQRGEFFRPSIQVLSRGNGLATNPAIRQQVFSQAYQVLMGNPFIGQDLEVAKDLTEQFIAAFGIHLALKDPQALQQSQLFLELLATKEGQAMLPAAMLQVIQALKTHPQSALPSEAPNGNRRPHVAAVR